MSEPLRSPKSATPAVKPSVPRPRLESGVRERAPSATAKLQLQASPVANPGQAAAVTRVVAPLAAKAGPPPLPAAQPILAKAGPPPLPPTPAVTRAVPPPLPAFVSVVPVEMAPAAWQQVSSADDVADFLDGSARRRRVIWMVVAVAVVVLLGAFGAMIASHFRPM